MSVTRYAPQEFWLDGTYARQTLVPKMVETAEGGYVSYFNYDALAQEVARLTKELEQVKEERDFLRGALEMIAGLRQCVDNLMSDKDIAREALEKQDGPHPEG